MEIIIFKTLCEIFDVNLENCKTPLECITQCIGVGQKYSKHIGQREEKGEGLINNLMIL